MFEVRSSTFDVVRCSVGKERKKGEEGTFGGEGFIVLGGVRGWIQTGYRKNSLSCYFITLNVHALNRF